jgi:hypothetical protein
MLKWVQTLETQGQFFSILVAGSATPSSWKAVLKESVMPANLFLKHLMLLSDYGGEPLKRLSSDFSNFFRNNDSSHIDIFFKDTLVRYDFKQLQSTSVSNSKLKVDGKGLAKGLALSDLTEDVCMLLLFANQSENILTDEFSGCIVGSFIGDADGLQEYAKSRYLAVSTQMKGAKANRMGQILQSQIVNDLQSDLKETFDVVSNRILRLDIDGTTSNEPFDIVIEKDGLLMGIEVSFQVTTNSTIERKGSQAETRKNAMHSKGHKIGYIVDGVGNFERKQAIMKILASSDITVPATEAGIIELSASVREQLA